MKKALLYLFAVILLISACSKKNNAPQTNNNASLLAGNWLRVTERDRFYKISNTIPTTSTLVEDTTLNITDKKYASTYVFNKNGTFYDVSYYEMPILDTIFFHYSVSNQSINYTYDINGLMEQYTILKLSTTNLELENSFDVTPSPGETQNLPPGSYNCVSDTYYVKQ